MVLFWLTKDILSYLFQVIVLRLISIHYFEIVFEELCDVMLGIRCVGVCGRHSEDPFVCFGAKATKRACVQYLPRDRNRTRERRSQRNNWLEREVKGRSVKRWDQVREENSEQKSERRPLEPVDPSRIDQHKILSQHSLWFCGNLARIHTRVSLQTHRMLGKCHRLLPSCTWSLFFFSSTLTRVFFVYW